MGVVAKISKVTLKSEALAEKSNFLTKGAVFKKLRIWAEKEGVVAKNDQSDTTKS